MNVRCNLVLALYNLQSDILGRSVKIAGLGHAHLQFGEVKKNFSHRIDGLTFGDRINGMMYALDGEHRIAPTSEYSFQYYVQVL